MDYLCFCGVTTTDVHTRAWRGLCDGTMNDGDEEAARRLRIFVEAFLT